MDIHIYGLSSTLQIVFWESSFPIRPVGRSGEYRYRSHSPDAV